MNDALKCNIPKCNSHLNGKAWVTRCFHVFCPEHGATYFQNNKIQLSCPICFEVNVHESDVLLCVTNPNDMILAGLRPEKILRLVEKSLRLWKCQMDSERSENSSKIYMLSRQIEENTTNFKRCLNEREAEYNSQIAALQENYNDVMSKLKHVNQELVQSKSYSKKYKVAYDSLINSSKPTSSSRLPCDYNPLHFSFDENGESHEKKLIWLFYIGFC